MKPKVFIARPLHKTIEAYIAEHCEYRMWDKTEQIPLELLYEEIQDVTGLLTNGLAINTKVLDKAPKLKIVSSMSVGYNNFDVDALKARNIMGTNTAGALDETVADLAFSLMLAASRRIAELDRYVKDGRWKKEDNESLFGLDVHHATVGIVGMGRIGEAIARRAKYGFSMNVLYHNRNRKPEIEQAMGVQYRDLNSLLRESDFVVVVTPLTEETKGMFGAEQFRQMKSTGIFVNVARGQVVDEAALIEALQTRQIYSAGLDVYEQEPVALDNPLLKMPHVVTIPHIGSATDQTRYDMAMLAARNLVMGVTGQTPPNLFPELR
ncbi:MAG: bifunctional glyoxylate/hydroxypyruvate reductase [Paenibacillus sp.]|jgi:gluconate 2-dehydrogenase|nr:bifunctional glyoxylate/hydroxypyruvate reductase [Paenibacillus sp.]